MPVTMREVTVAGISVPPNGIPATGVILFVMPSALYDDTGNMILGRGYYSLTLVAGAGSVSVPVNDDAGVTPQGWQYRALIRTEDDWKEDGLIEVPSGVGPLEFVPNFVPSSAEPSAGVTYATLAALQAEAATRAAADAALSASITSEAGTRAAADTTLSNSITAEATARATADSTHAALTAPAHGIANTALLLTAALAADAAARFPRSTAADRTVEWRTAAQVLSDIGGAAASDVADIVDQLDGLTFLVLASADPIPPGTPSNTVIFRTAG